MKLQDRSEMKGDKNRWRCTPDASRNIGERNGGGGRHAAWPGFGGWGRQLRWLWDATGGGRGRQRKTGGAGRGAHAPGDRLFSRIVRAAAVLGKPGDFGKLSLHVKEPLKPLATKCTGGKSAPSNAHPRMKGGNKAGHICQIKITRMNAIWRPFTCAPSYWRVPNAALRPPFPPPAPTISRYDREREGKGRGRRGSSTAEGSGCRGTMG